MGKSLFVFLKSDKTPHETIIQQYPNIQVCNSIESNNTKNEASFIYLGNLDDCTIPLRPESITEELVLGFVLFKDKIIKCAAISTDLMIEAAKRYRNPNTGFKIILLIVCLALLFIVIYFRKEIFSMENTDEVVTNQNDSKTELDEIANNEKNLNNVPKLLNNQHDELDKNNSTKENLDKPVNDEKNLNDLPT